MKQFTFSILVLIVISLFIACKKDNTLEVPKPAEGIAGVWVGEYDYYDGEISYYYSFEIKADGKMKEISYTHEIAGEGTWTLTGNLFMATYTSTGAAGKIYSVKATYDPVAKKFTGSWGKGNKTDTGDFYMIKK